MQTLMMQAARGKGRTLADWQMEALQEIEQAAFRLFLQEQGYGLCGKHYEIYLGDPRKSAPDKLRTVIRQPIA